MTPQGIHSQDEAGITVTVSLSEKGDLLRLQSSDFDERVDHCCRLLGVACAVINDVAVWRIIAQDRTAREWSEKQRFLFVGQRNGDNCRRGPDIADDRENIVLFNQLPHIGRGAGWFVSIIECNEPQLATVHTSVSVCAFQAGLDAPLHVFAQVSSVASQYCGHSKDNFGWRIGSSSRCRRAAPEREEKGQND